jgi:hypothetical protein
MHHDALASREAAPPYLYTPCCCGVEANGPILTFARFSGPLNRLGCVTVGGNQITGELNNITLPGSQVRNALTAASLQVNGPVCVGVVWAAMHWPPTRRRCPVADTVCFSMPWPFFLANHGGLGVGACDLIGGLTHWLRLCIRRILCRGR